MRTVFIVNPVAGSGRALRVWTALEHEALQACAPAAVVFTTAPGTASTLARDAADRATRLVAVGGDGTFNEVLNGLMVDDGCHRPDVTLSLVSVGTGRDLARSLGLPRDPRMQLARVVSGTPRPFDVGRVTYRAQRGQGVRYFANVASFGLSGATDRIMAHRWLRRLPPRLAFQVAVVQALLVYRNAPIRLAGDDGVWQDITVKVVAVCNGQYFGAGMHIGPQADVADGRLDCVVIGDIGRVRLLQKLGTVYRGAHLQLPEVTCWNARRVVAEPLSAGTEVLLDIDGEPIGALPATFELLSHAMTLRY